MTSQSDNSTAMKIGRSYKRLLIEILNKSPEWLINYYFAEAQGWAAPRLLDLEEIKKEAENYILVYQGGRTVPVLKSSHFGKAIIYGKKEKKEDD